MNLNEAVPLEFILNSVEEWKVRHTIGIYKPFCFLLTILLGETKVIPVKVGSPAVIACNSWEIVPMELRSFNASEIETVMLGSILDIDKKYRVMAILNTEKAIVSAPDISLWNYFSSENAELLAGNVATVCADAGQYFCLIKHKRDAHMHQQIIKLEINVASTVSAVSLARGIRNKGEEGGDNITVYCSALAPNEGHLKWFVRCRSSENHHPNHDNEASIIYRLREASQYDIVGQEKCQAVRQTSVFNQRKHDFADNCNITCCVYKKYGRPNSVLKSLDIDCSTILFEGGTGEVSVAPIYDGVFGSMSVMLVMALAFMSSVIFLLCCIWFSLLEDEKKIDFKKRKFRKWMINRYRQERRREKELKKLRKMKHRHSEDLFSQDSFQSATPRRSSLLSHGGFNPGPSGHKGFSPGSYTQDSISRGSYYSTGYPTTDHRPR